MPQHLLPAFRQSAASLARLASLGLGVLALAVSAACGPGAQPEATRSGQANPVTSDSDAAPDFVATALDGEEVSLADTAGRVRLIDFWATWCAPCREEIPMLVELDKTYRDQGLTILALSDEDTDVVREFVSGKGITYTNLIDPGEIARDYLVLGLPTGFLIDREGNIVERFTGPKPAKILEKRIRELLELPPA